MENLPVFPPLPPPPPPLPPIEILSLPVLPPLPPPPPVPKFNELMTFQENGNYYGKDVFAAISTHDMDFWAMTGETVYSFRELTEDIRPQIEGGAGRPHMLSTENRLLMTLFWLKKYPDLVTLSTIFDVNPQSVSRNLHGMIDILWDYVQSGIQWLNEADWRDLRGNWESIPVAVGAIDGTVHTIYMPQEDPHLYYSGHAHRYCFSTQIIVDNKRNIRHIHSGFLGHSTDARQYRLIAPVGPGQQLSVPQGCYLLADKIYPNEVPLLTAWKANELRGEHRNRRILFNLEHAHHRIHIEHVIRKLKEYRVLQERFRHPRGLMTKVVDVCACLANRHVKLFGEIR